MATLYECNNGAGLVKSNVGRANWGGTSFSPEISHTITELRLWLETGGAYTRIIYVGIKALGADGKPTGYDLCNGSTSDLPASPGDWRTISLGKGYALVAGQSYAIVVSAPFVIFGDEARWWYNNEPYARGHRLWSTDWGATWSITLGLDFLFEDWGVPSVDFSANLSELERGTTYYFTPSATNAYGTSYGVIKTFTTKKVADKVTNTSVSTLAATKIAENHATLNGGVEDSLTRYGQVRFEYGLTPSYGMVTPWQDGFITGDEFHTDIKNLSEGQSYHFRAQLMASPIVSGGDAVFSTLSALGPVTMVSEELLQLLEA